MTLLQGIVATTLWIGMGVLYIQSNPGLVGVLGRAMDRLPLVTTVLFIVLVLLWPVTVVLMAQRYFWWRIQEHRKKGK
jgi:hypothetical protein